MKPLVAVIILNWNGWEDTVDLLDSLASVTYDPTLIIVIDNASEDDSLKHMRRWFQQENVSNSKVATNTAKGIPGDYSQHFHLVALPENVGFCAGNNIGMAIASQVKAEYLLVLNNDTVVQPDFLEPMVALASSENVGLVGGIITYFDEPDTVWWAGGEFNRFLSTKRILDRQPLSALAVDEPFPTEWVSGCMMMIPTDIYHELGGFAEEYFIWSEEWDYSRRVSQAGYKLMVQPNSRIQHKVGRSLGIMKPLNYYYGIRNGLLFRRKFLSWYLWYPFVLSYLGSRVIRYTQLLLLGRRDLSYAGSHALIDFFAGRFGKWSKQA